MDVGDTVKPVNAGGAAVTFTVTPAVKADVVKPVPEPFAVTVIVAVPGATAVTTPDVAFTDAIAALLDAYAYVTATAEAAFVTFGTIVNV